jgi:hypothetical protein
MRLTLSGTAVVLVTLSAARQADAQPHFDRILELPPAAGVFAYARISPDGRRLAYAVEAKDPNRRRPMSQEIVVSDLQTGAVLFSEPGIDPYWSPDGDRIIYESFKGGRESVSIHEVRRGRTTRDVVPTRVGDYYSWGVKDGKDLILTITSHYFYLAANRAVLPVLLVRPCEGIGVGDRPLLSHDGRQLTTFVGGTIVVRNLADCDSVLDTGFQGAKADFSWDGRYIAFHAPKESGIGYDVFVIDLRERTVRTITQLPGASFFPSWTRDGRICFRYETADYHGFVMVSDVLAAPARPLPTSDSHVPQKRSWEDIFPETAWPGHSINVVMVWSPWSAHSPIALTQLQLARAEFVKMHVDAEVLIASDPASQPDDIDRMLLQERITLTRIPVAQSRLRLTEEQNQIPAILLFRDGRLLDRRLGAQSVESLREWVAAAARARR